MHCQLKKDMANDYSKGNHKAVTLINEYKPLKLDVTHVLAQGTAFATTSHKEGKEKKGPSGNTKHISDPGWKAMSPEAQTKTINTCKKAAGEDEDDNSSASSKSATTMKSLEKDNHSLEKSVSALRKCEEDDDDDLSTSSAAGSSHFQKLIMTLKDSHPKIVFALRSSKSHDLD